MTDHDIVAYDGDGYRCRCGRSFTTPEKHDQHFQLERARAALRGEKEVESGT